MQPDEPEPPVSGRSDAPIRLNQPPAGRGYASASAAALALGPLGRGLQLGARAGTNHSGQAQRSPQDLVGRVGVVGENLNPHIGRPAAHESPRSFQGKGARAELGHLAYDGDPCGMAGYPAPEEFGCGRRRRAQDEDSAFRRGRLAVTVSVYDRDPLDVRWPKERLQRSVTLRQAGARLLLGVPQHLTGGSMLAR